MHSIYPWPVSRLRGGLVYFNEVMYMWIIVGYILCKVAKTAGSYTHLQGILLRNVRPGLLL